MLLFFTSLLLKPDIEKYKLFSLFAASLLTVFLSFAGYTAFVFLNTISAIFVLFFVCLFHSKKSKKNATNITKIFWTKIKRILVYPRTYFFLIPSLLFGLYLFEDILKKANSSRLFSIIEAVIASGTNSLTVLVNTDDSIQDRAIAFFLPFFSMSHNMFGYGVSGVSQALSDTKLTDEVFLFLSIDSDNIYSGISTTRLMSTIGNYLVDFGIVGFLLILSFLFFSYNRITKYSVRGVSIKYLAIFIFFFILLNLTGHYPVGFPLSWFVLGLISNRFFYLNSLNSNIESKKRYRIK